MINIIEACTFCLQMANCCMLMLASSCCWRVATAAMYALRRGGEGACRYNVSMAVKC